MALEVVVNVPTVPPDHIVLAGIVIENPPPLASFISRESTCPIAAFEYERVVDAVTVTFCLSPFNQFIVIALPLFPLSNCPDTLGNLDTPVIADAVTLQLVT